MAIARPPDSIREGERLSSDADQRHEREDPDDNADRDPVLRAEDVRALTPQRYPPQGDGHKHGRGQDPPRQDPSRIIADEDVLTDLKAAAAE